MEHDEAMRAIPVKAGLGPMDLFGLCIEADGGKVLLVIQSNYMV